MPIPDKSDLRRFCELDGWEQRPTTDHHRYTKELPDGTILRTKVSLGRGQVCDDPALWSRIWRHQLQLESEEQFWEVLQSREPVPRGEPQPEPQQPRMPAWLFDYLIYRVELDEDKALGLSEEEAMEIYMEHIKGEGEAPA